jgi:predicted nuclease of predicted toxin-antitoxin system
MLSGVFPDCVHVTRTGLRNASDDEIWTFARRNNHCIVTFDADFINIATLRGYPPKIIHLTTGNRTTTQITTLLTSNKNLIEAFLHEESYKNLSCLEIAD